MATNLCLKCGSANHFGTNCRASNSCAVFPESEDKFGPPICKHCGANTHFTEDCEFK